MYVSSISIGIKLLLSVPALIASIQPPLTLELVPSGSATSPLTPQSRELLTTNYHGELFSLMKMVPLPVKVLALGLHHTMLTTITPSVNTTRLTTVAYSAITLFKFVELHSLVHHQVIYSEAWPLRLSDTTMTLELNSVIPILPKNWVAI